MVSPLRSHRMMLGGWKPPTSNLKSNFNISGLIILFLIIALMMSVIFFISTKPKTPATSEQVWNTIVAQGYEPEDIADMYHNQDPESKNSLLKCIAFKNSDMHFEFF